MPLSLIGGSLASDGAGGLSSPLEETPLTTRKRWGVGIRQSTLHFGFRPREAWCAS